MINWHLIKDVTAHGLTPEFLQNPKPIWWEYKGLCGIIPLSKVMNKVRPARDHAKQPNLKNKPPAPVVYWEECLIVNQSDGQTIAVQRPPGLPR